MHIAIEGIDGVGKTTVAKILAHKLDWTFVEKPFHYISDKNSSLKNYLELSNTINNIPNSDIRALFYGIGNAYASLILSGTNIVTDRHLVSNFIWNSSSANQLLFDYLINLCGTPDYTILLYADEETRRKRIINRGDSIVELNTSDYIDNVYSRMEEFLKHYNMKYTFFDSTNISATDTANAIYDIVISNISC